MHILILDYSVTRIATPTIRPWLPEDAPVTALFIDTLDSFPDNLIEQGFTHVIHSGSELSITEPSPFMDRASIFVREAHGRNVAQMGICYGHQLVCRALIGPEAVRASPNGFEAGWGDIFFGDGAEKELGVRPVEQVWQHHFDEVIQLPQESEVIATNEHTPIQAYIHRGHRLLGTQFHPEVQRGIGNKIFSKDRLLLEAHGHDVDDILSKGPSFEAGRVFFTYFLEHL
jgi:GMP synthase-like glutamine amidotransferase